MSAFSELLGSTLLSDGANVSTSEALDGKVVGLYFSAHWCPPCRGFTPKLAEWYLKWLKAKNFEVVFVSSDQDESQFKEYFGDMPWLALPYEDKARKMALSKKFKVRGIPMLIILNEKAEVITLEGREVVSQDTSGKNFPWIPAPPAPLKEELGTKFLKQGGALVGSEALEGKVLGLYFSAHWCPPCRGFTPVLTEAYKKYIAKGLNFEVIFVSSDGDESQFKAYFDEMPWLALPYSERATKDALSKRFKVQGIPTLVLIDVDGTVITTNGRGAVQNDPEGKDFPWHPKPVRDLSDPEGIDETPSVVVLMEQVEKEAQEKVISALEPVARKFGNPGDDAKYLFFAGTKSVGPVPRVRELLGQPALEDGAQSAALFLLDLDDDGAYYEATGIEITSSAVEDLLSKYEAKSLERKQISG